MASIPRIGSTVGQLNVISPIEVQIDQDIGVDLRESESQDLRQIAKLLDCSNTDFPFMEGDLRALKSLKNRVSLIEKEFYLNYGRFALGAACGFMAVLLYYTSPKVTPLLSGFGAGLSGSFGVCVTKIRAINLHSLQKSQFVESLKERHVPPASGLIKLAHTNPSLAKQIAEKMQQRLLIAFEHPENRGLEYSELVEICSPLTQVSSFILKKTPLENPLLSLTEEVTSLKSSQLPRPSSFELGQEIAKV